MKKCICLLIAAVICISFSSCVKEQEYDQNYIDLTSMSGTMVYSEVLNMMMAPEEYEGKTVKMHGVFSAPIMRMITDTALLRMRLC